MDTLKYVDSDETIAKYGIEFYKEIRDIYKKTAINCSYTIFDDLSASKVNSYSTVVDTKLSVDRYLYTIKVRITLENIFSNVIVSGYIDVMNREDTVNKTIQSDNAFSIHMPNFSVDMSDKDTIIDLMQNYNEYVEISYKKSMELVKKNAINILVELDNKKAFDTMSIISVDTSDRLSISKKLHPFNIHVKYNISCNDNLYKVSATGEVNIPAYEIPLELSYEKIYTDKDIQKINEDIVKGEKREEHERIKKNESNIKNIVDRLNRLIKREK